jgi:DNA (cytosine-5)-methyltransferase 1
MNDFFILCDTRNGHTTIHSWDIKRTSKREREVCVTILKNRRKSIYGDADGNPLSLIELRQLIPDIKFKDLQSLIKKNILKQKGNGYELFNSKNSTGINGIYRVYLPNSDVFSTLTATGTKDMIALKLVAGNSPSSFKRKFINEILRKRQYREISVKEAARLQGFPDHFVFLNGEKAAKRQLGNAVPTTVVYHLVRAVINTEVFKKGSNEISNIKQDVAPYLNEVMV